MYMFLLILPELENFVLPSGGDSEAIRWPIDSVNFVGMAWKILTQLFRLHAPHCNQINNKLLEIVI